MKKAWEKWKEVAQKIGNFQAGVVFSLLYFVLIVPIGVVANLFTDFLGVRRLPGWENYDIDVDSMDKLKEQS